MNTPFNPGYYETEELRTMGFKAVGDRVRIAKTCTIVGLENIEIGSNVRIDGYATISAYGETGSLKIGSYIHIGGYCFLQAGDGLEIRNFAGLSQGVRIYTRSDDYSGEFMTNPTVPEHLTGVVRGKVVLGEHVIVGSGSIILPGVEIGDGASVGAVSLIKNSLEGWGVYFGAPAKRIGTRSKNLLELAKELNV